MSPAVGCGKVTPQELEAAREPLKRSAAEVFSCFARADQLSPVLISGGGVSGMRVACRPGRIGAAGLETFENQPGEPVGVPPARFDRPAGSLGIWVSRPEFPA